MNALASFSLQSRAAHSAKNAPCEIANAQSAMGSLHSVTPSSPQQHEVQDVEKLRGLSGRTRVTREQLRTQLHVVFRETVTGQSKEVARNLEEISADTIDSWRQVSIPRAWADLAKVSRVYPVFGLHALDILGLDIDADRTAYSQFLELQRRIRGQ